MSYRSQVNGERGASGIAINKHHETVPAPIQYVFIDETQRDSKRLKITRACESCRKRKVKCDAPHVAAGEACTSCKRLGVECVLQQSGHDSAMDDRPGTNRVPGHDDERIPRTVLNATLLPLATQRMSTSPNSIAGSDTTYARTKSIAFHRERRRPSASTGPSLGGVRGPDVDLTITNRAPGSHGSKGIRVVNTLTDIFGKLNVSATGRALFLEDLEDPRGRPPYNPEQFETTVSDASSPSVPAYPVEFEAIQGLLPPEDLARDLIEIFFDNIHPYIPVLNKAAFCRHWSGPDRRTMSPYLLVSFFAAAARHSGDKRVCVLEDPNTRGDRWHDLVNRYKDDFHDAPRISTIQADIINIKALESRPKTPGYFYRCWFLLSCVIRMGKDLGLHRLGEYNAPFSPGTITGRRVWQICLIMDQVMGTGQGRELQLSIDEVDLTLLPEARQSEHDLDLAEIKIQNDFVYFTGLIKILRRWMEVNTMVGIKFPFSAEPQYPALNDVLMQWRSNLPDHLVLNGLTDQILSSHFVGNLHITFHMIVCLLHRPWIVSVGEYGESGEWRMHLQICNDSARQAVALFETMFHQYGDAGVAWMIRGNNSALYASIVITMIHAVCLTCPESQFNDGSRDYLARSLAIIDRLAKNNPQVRLDSQLDLIRSMLAKASPGQGQQSMINGTKSSDEQSFGFEQPRVTGRKKPPPPLSGNFTRQFDYNSHYQTDQQNSFLPSSYPSMANQGSPYYQSMPMNIPDPLAVDTSSQGMGGSTIDSSPHSTVLSPAPGSSWNPASVIGTWHQNFPMVSSGMDYASQFVMQGTVLQERHDPLIPTPQMDPYYSQDVNHQLFPNVPQHHTQHHHLSQQNTQFNIPAGHSRSHGLETNISDERGIM